MSLEKLFHLKENHTDVKTEVLAGITTFMTMAYILAVNPGILGATDMDSGAVFTATAVSALGVTLSQFFQEGNSENLTEVQKEVLKIGNDLSTNEQETVMFFLCTVERYSIIKPVFLHTFKNYNSVYSGSGHTELIWRIRKWNRKKMKNIKQNF